MSNYLVDGADLTSVADAIRAKGGTSGQLQFPGGFVDAVEAIPSGGGATAGIVGVTIDSTTATEITLKLPDLNSLNVSSSNSLSIETIDITAGSSEITTQLNGGSSTRGGALKTIDLHGAKVLVSHAYGCRWRENLETLNAKCRMTVTNTGNQFTGTTKLKEIYWQENKQTISLSLAACPLLTDDSVVSIANGLNGGTVATLTLHATPKARCSTLMGTISQVTEGGTTYDFFTQDASGTVTLADFITQTKGWTLA